MTVLLVVPMDPAAAMEWTHMFDPNEGSKRAVRAHSGDVPTEGDPDLRERTDTSSVVAYWGHGYPSSGVAPALTAMRCACVDLDGLTSSGVYRFARLLHSVVTAWTAPHSRS